VDWLTFIAKIVEVIAWPLVVAWTLYLIRPHISKVLGYLRKIKIKDFEAEFGEGIRDARSEAEEAGLRPSKQNKVTDDNNFMMLATQFPALAIIESFKSLETVLNDMAQSPEFSSLTHSPYQIVGYLAQQGRIDKHTLSVYDRLRRLRNMAAHAKEIDVSPGEVIEFRELAVRLADRLSQEFLHKSSEQNK
jgi:hypothetical protein